MTGLSLEREFGQVFGSKISDFPPLTSMQEIEEHVNGLHELYCKSYKDGNPSVTAAVTVDKITFPRPDCDDGVMWSMTPAELAPGSAQPAIFYIHPGGHIIGTAEQFIPVTSYYSHNLGYKVFSVEHRLAPEHPYPAGADDVFHAYEFLIENYERFGIDRAKIVVMGLSAGAGLAAGLCIRLRDLKYEYQPIQQVLLAPMLDDRTGITPEHPRNKFLTWTTSANQLAWKALLGDIAGDTSADVSQYVSPARATNLADLPAAYIDLGSLDLFVEESLEYARRLSSAGVQVEIHVWPGLPHGYDFYGLKSMEKAFKFRANAIKEMMQ